MSSVPPPEESQRPEPFQQYYYPTPPPPATPPAAPSQQQRSGAMGAVLAAALVIFKFKTALSLVISFGAYAWLLGPLGAAGLVLMILLHEMGHVFEIRRQGMQATAPLFIPFMGAAIFQRSHPTDALKQAQIGIAGPVAGTIAATAALGLYTSTHWSFLLAWASIGFFINLINLIPVGMLDGGWILAVVSKWFQVVGIVILGIAIIQFHLSSIFLIIVVLSIPTILDRFRSDRQPYFQSVPVSARLAMGAAWLALAGYLAVVLFTVNPALLSYLQR
jgi:Zn-dependent protease